MHTLQALTLIKKRLAAVKPCTVVALALACLCLYWLSLFYRYAVLHDLLASGTLPLSAQPDNLMAALPVPYIAASRLFFLGFPLLTLLQALCLNRFCSLYHPLGVVGGVYSPFKAIIVYCLPLLNLFLPCLAWQEAWRVSCAPGAWQQETRSRLVFLWWVLFVGALAVFCVFVFRALQLEHAAGMALFIQLPRFIWLGFAAASLIFLESLLSLYLVHRIRSQWALAAARGLFPNYNANN